MMPSSMLPDAVRRIARLLPTTHAMNALNALAMRQAAERGHCAEDELLLYAVHGTLHLMGYDDHDASSRKAMHKRALDVLAGVGRALDS